MTSPVRAITFASLLALAACQREAPAPAKPALQVSAPTPIEEAPQPKTEAERRIAEDVKQLADDRMEGRETGTRGYDLAAEYVAKRFREIGLVPAGDDGSYFQAVPLLEARVEQAGAELRVTRNGRDIALRFQDQFLPAANFNAPEHRVEAAAVFVGQGVHAPTLGHDDFAGLDLKGKIAVVFGGAPARFDNDRRAFHSSSREKLRALVARGAVGAVFVNTPEDEAGSPWAQRAADWRASSMRLRGSDGKGLWTFPELRGIAYVSAASADLVFADGPRTAAQLFDAARAGTLKGFALPGTLTLAGRTTLKPIESRNVVAALPGGDPALAGESTVFTAHLDHVGIGPAVEGDTIRNGALDNALGVAIMLEAARALKTGPAPKRGTLFIATTAEEKGLLGAEWFATHPVAAAGTMVANINIDMPVLLAPSRDVVPVGVEHSSLKQVLDTAAKEIGVEQSPDPFPEEVVFVRSDQYAFIRTGVPAVYLMGGMVSADGERDPGRALQNFLRRHYHQPSDEATLPIVWSDAARLAALNARIARIVGDAKTRPTWNAGNFFGETFAAGKP
ncbi:MAG: M20/M25/M40 family metallo-hydrolase [Lysobacter sp.]|nr:M20/M25/M40 family metallo-hydrolase [Lysobacter sp.]